MNNIAGKTALVTGGSKGIGASVAKMFAKNGAGHLILVARRSDEFKAFISELESIIDCKKQKITAFEIDLSSMVELKGLAGRLGKLNETIHVLINNAGLTIPKTIYEANIEELIMTMQVNLYSPFYLVQFLLQNGNKFEHIINIASTAGIKGRSGWSTYSSSKAALIAFSESLREELLPLGTRVSVISPGRCATGLRRVLAPDEDQSTIMQPEDVAEVIKVLLSDVGHFIDSENMVVRL